MLLTLDFHIKTILNTAYRKILLIANELRYFDALMSTLF